MSILGTDVTFVILAGGYSRRFDGKIKALQQIEGQSLLERRISSLKNLNTSIIISVSSEEIKDRCLSVFKDIKINNPHISFFTDINEDQGPMQALYHIIPSLKTKYGLVIGVDNVMIDLADISQLVDLIKSNSNCDLSSVLIDKQRLVASFFAFNVINIKDLFIKFPVMATFERLVDLFRITQQLVLLGTIGEGQFMNVNTPEQLENIDLEKVTPVSIDKIYHINPKYFGKMGLTCQSFKNELKSWLLPEIIPHIRENILRDAKNLLGGSYNECDFEEN